MVDLSEDILEYYKFAATIFKIFDSVPCPSKYPETPSLIIPYLSSVVLSVKWCDWFISHELNERRDDFGGGQRRCFSWVIVNLITHLSGLTICILN